MPDESALPADPPDSGFNALDEQIVAEIHILVDFISGRGDKSLAGGAVGKLPAGFTDYGNALSEFFRISDSMADARR
jgi:hypothetical protein